MENVMKKRLLGLDRMKTTSDISSPIKHLNGGHAGYLYSKDKKTNLLLNTIYSSSNNDNNSNYCNVQGFNTTNTRDCFSMP
jgi:hypothetical protein